MGFWSESLAYGCRVRLPDPDMFRSLIAALQTSQTSLPLDTLNLHDQCPKYFLGPEYLFWVRSLGKISQTSILLAVMPIARQPYTFVGRLFLCAEHLPALCPPSFNKSFPMAGTLSYFLSASLAQSPGVTQSRCMVPQRSQCFPSLLCWFGPFLAPRPWCPVAFSLSSDP